MKRDETERKQQLELEIKKARNRITLRALLRYLSNRVPPELAQEIMGWILVAAYENRGPTRIVSLEHAQDLVADTLPFPNVKAAADILAGRAAKTEETESDLLLGDGMLGFATKALFKSLIITLSPISNPNASLLAAGANPFALGNHAVSLRRVELHASVAQSAGPVYPSQLYRLQQHAGQLTEWLPRLLCLTFVITVPDKTGMFHATHKCPGLLRCRDSTLIPSSWNTRLEEARLRRRHHDAPRRGHDAGGQAEQAGCAAKVSPCQSVLPCYPLEGGNQGRTPSSPREH